MTVGLEAVMKSRSCKRVRELAWKVSGARVNDVKKALDSSC